MTAALGPRFDPEPCPACGHRTVCPACSLDIFRVVQMVRAGRPFTLRPVDPLFDDLREQLIAQHRRALRTPRRGRA